MDARGTPLIAVTGATGYLGAATVASLVSRGSCRIRVLSRAADLVPGADEVVLGSLLDDGACERLVDGADIVIHAAALVRSTDAVALGEVNVEGTMRLLRAARTGGVRRFVHVSSTGVYGHPRTRVDESSPRRPSGPYERSKASAEACVLEDGGWAVVVQPSNVIGPRHPLRPLRRFLNSIRSGRPVVHAGAWTNYVGIGDVARVIVLAATSDDVPPVLIINSPMPLGNLARLAGRIVGRPARSIALPAALGSVLAPPIGGVARWAPGFRRVEALVDRTRFCTSHEAWFQANGAVTNLEEALVEMAHDYGFR